MTAYSPPICLEQARADAVTVSANEGQLILAAPDETADNKRDGAIPVGQPELSTGIHDQAEADPEAAPDRTAGRWPARDCRLRPSPVDTGRPPTYVAEIWVSAQLRQRVQAATWTRRLEGADAMTDRPPAQERGADQAAADPATVCAELPADLTSPRQARAAIRQALTAWHMRQLSGDAEHGDGHPIGLALRRHAEPDGRPGVTCEVTDTASEYGQRQAPAPDAERGRGLVIVAPLTQSSGVRASQAGMTSWFTLALTDRAHRVARQLEHEPEAGA